MKALKPLIITALLLLGALPLRAQEFLWEGYFDYRFDNREYESLSVAESGTLYGARIVPLAGIGWGRGNAVMAGADLMTDFGLGSFHTNPEFLIYYKYTGEKFTSYFGKFPRYKVEGEYTNAIFSDSVRFYDSCLEGLLLQYKGRRGYAELGLDWNSMPTDEQRERFMIFSAGRLDLGIFYLGYNLSMLHHAGSDTERGVVDNVLLYPHAGIDLSGRYGFGKLYLRAGWLQAFQNDRRYIGEYVLPGGAQVEARVERWGFGLYNSLYLGKGLMPYFTGTVADQPDYGYGLYYGDPYYRTDSGIYDRVELYWQLRTRYNVNVCVASVHHFDGGGWGWQQTLTVQILLNKELFRKKN